MFGLFFGGIGTMVQAGFIIGAGLLLDTFLVRTVTVPALVVLIGKANWWPSAAVSKLLANWPGSVSRRAQRVSIGRFVQRRRPEGS